VKAVANWDADGSRYRKVAGFVDALLTRLDDSQQSPRHPNWREVGLNAQLPDRGPFYPVDEWLRRNDARTLFVVERTDPRPGAG
jgi:hypothetical protein